MRVKNLQELVYKQGQAGITKATVTLVFNNEKTEASPIGYEQYDRITVTRQVVLGGRNKYLIQGHSAQVNQVQNLFHSVQLNVNNPHFLIMQARFECSISHAGPHNEGAEHEGGRDPGFGGGSVWDAFVRDEEGAGAEDDGEEGEQGERDQQDSARGCVCVCVVRSRHHTDAGEVAKPAQRVPAVGVELDGDRAFAPAGDSVRVLQGARDAARGRRGEPSDRGGAEGEGRDGSRVRSGRVWA